jgi:hypothetical protein
MGGACSIYGEKRNASRIWVVKRKEKGVLQRSRHRWVDNIKMDIKEIGREGMVWIFQLRIEASGGLLCKRQLTYMFL